ncbi:hypothetical protein U9M48_008761 [Paspalum notatum var. saurae]|uniref:Integrase catalytic domain-containing protein n=1 Tax=Paspalum notatum var. saurae TaxID=547442 RepID=A0AAQ3SQ73_PASNO
MPRRRSTSPPRRLRGESRPPESSGRSGGGSGGGLVIHRVTKEISSSGSFPALTRTNYYDWAALMRVMLQARGLWIAVSVGTNDLTEDRMALEVLSKAVPVEMMGTIANKATAKLAWDSIRVMNIGVERVRKAKASTLRREFDSLKFRDGETALPAKFEQIASSIETLLDLADLTVEELIGRPKATEERHNLTNSIASLNLTEDELVARSERPGERTSSRKKGRGRGRSSGSGRGGGNAGRDGGNAARDECRYYGKKGHWARECRKKKKDAAAHTAQAEEAEGEALLVATATVITAPSSATSSEAIPLPREQGVHINEDKLFVQLGDGREGDCTRWILDTGATNHMTSSRSAFSNLDTGVRGTVKFGDGSVVGIEGRGTVLFNCKNGEHHALAGVYHIPRLTTNIVSLGQLEEDGYKILMENGFLRIWDRSRRLLAKVPRTHNRLYQINLDISKPVCLAAQGTDVAWRWHARYGHINFRALRLLANKEMHKLELVHGDLCGPVTPSTPSGNKYFLLLVDDLSRYMWLMLLSTKDQAAATIMRFKGVAEAEARRKLGTLRTDRGGEFTARAFADLSAGTSPLRTRLNGMGWWRGGTDGHGRSMMKAKALPGSVTTAVNRAPTQSVEGKTPYEVWHGAKPPVHYLRTFGCVAHVKVAGKHLAKLDDRSTPMVFVGYEPGTKAYRFYNPNTRRVHVSRDAVFEEERSWEWGADKGAGPGDDVEPFHVEYVTITFDTSGNSKLSSDTVRGRNAYIEHGDARTRVRAQDTAGYNAGPRITGARHPVRVTAGG